MTVMVCRHKVLNLQQLLLLVLSIHIATSGVDFRITESALTFTSGQYGLDGILKCSDIIILNDQVYYYCCYCLVHCQGKNNNHLLFTSVT